MSRAPLGAEPTGLQLREHMNARHKTLFDAASFPLTSVGGTPNAVTASLDPELDGDGLLDGMSFTLTWASENTGGVTLAINGGSPVSVLDAAGAALAPGAVGTGLRSLITYTGGSFALVSPTLLMGGTAGIRYSWTFVTSGTWTKPTGLPAATPILLRGWGGGGGGSSTSSGAGGGGGAYIERWVTAGAVGATVTVTIGAGGGQNNAGGSSTFGTQITAFGGGGGSGGEGGTGGGTNESGADGGYLGGGAGGKTGPNPIVTEDGGLYGGGGGGSGVATDTSLNGGRAVYGGGGGGGGSGSGGSGGVSLFSGNGGAAGSAGGAPSGGGGRQASGARGEIRVFI